MTPQNDLQNDPPVAESDRPTAVPLEPWDRKARLAIEGMGPSEIANKLELYERHYDDWLEHWGEGFSLRPADEMADSAATDLVGKILCRAFPKTVTDMLERTRESAIMIMKGACKIFRQEVEELALAHAKAMTDLRAASARDSFHAQYCKMVDENRQLRSFLLGNFAEYVERADALHIPLIDIAKTIMMDQKRAGANPAPSFVGDPGAPSPDVQGLNSALRREELDAGR